MNLTRDRIAELKRLAEALGGVEFKAELGEASFYVWDSEGKSVCKTLRIGKWDEPRTVADFIAAANPKTISALLALAERALEPQGQAHCLACAGHGASLDGSRDCAKCGGSGSTDATMSMNCKDCDGTDSQPQGQAHANPYQATFPQRVWLNVGDCTESELAEFSSHHEITWADSQIDQFDIEYVRTDLASQEAQPKLQGQALPELPKGWPNSHPYSYTADQMHAYARAYASQLALPAGPVPEGWQLVPAVPTLDMIRAMDEGANDDDDGQSIEECYAQEWFAALKAAPKPPAASPAVAQPVADEREAYDKWCVSKGYNTNKWTSSIGLVYLDNYTLTGWEAWQARAALCQPAEEGDKV